MLLTIILLTLTAAGLTWWILKRQLATLQASARAQAALADKEQPLSIARQDEIGQLIGGSNRLLAELRQRKALLRQILDTATVAIFVVDRQGRITQANQRMAEIFGCPLENLVGQEYVALIHPGERDVGRQKMLALLASEIPFVNSDRLYWRADQTEFWGHLNGKRFFNAEGIEQGLIGVIADITERKHAEHFEQFRSRILELLAGGEPLSRILEELVRGVEQLNPQMLCSVLLLDKQGTHLSVGAAPSLPDFFSTAIDGIEIGMGVGSCGTAAFTGQRVVVADISTHPYWAPYKELAARAGLGACWAQPIHSSLGQVLGTFAIYHRDPHSPVQADIFLIEQSARLASIAIERSIAAEKIRDSEAHFRLLTEGVTDVVWKQDRNNYFTYISPADERLRGYRADEVIGHHVFEIMTPEGVATVKQAMTERKSAEHDSTRSDTLTIVAQMRCKDGRAIWAEILSTPERDTQGAIIGFQGISRDITERRLAEENLQLAANVFTHACEGIMITTSDGTIIDVNESFSRITGYSRAEALGQSPRLISSGRQSTTFYANLWRELIKNGQWDGELWNRRKNGEIYAQTQTISTVRDAHGRPHNYVALFSDITAFKVQQQQLEHIAHFDVLTGLPNRVLLADRMQQAMVQVQRRGQRLAVAYLDLDGFKTINDRHGHAVGDQLLMAVASRMKQSLREGDTLARLGGDEFVAVLLDLTDVAACVPVLTRLLAAAAQPLQLGELTLQVSASLGVTFYPQAQDIDADQLLRQSDQTMYQAKLAGKNRFNFFDAEHDSSIRGHHQNVERIRQALAQQEFVLFYQPKVNMRSGAVIGAEALIRWQHPEKGLLPPALFLPVIEDHPLAVELGEWAIHNALRQIERWQESGLDLPISVNVGARQLQQADFVTRLRDILAAHPNVKPGQLELEVLETSALEDMNRVSKIIEACRLIGVHFALDDFGTGFSSLTYLKHLRITLLKIDRSFVRNMLNEPDDLAILEGVIGLASAFRCKVIAEGVETLEHGTLLLQLGCEMAQGYGIARAMPAHELSQWATTWRVPAVWANLAPVSRDNLPVLRAGVEFRAWIAAIEAFLKGTRETPPSLDPRQCRFGIWLSGEGLARHGAQSAFQAIEPLCHEVHGLAAALCQLHQQGDSAQALQRLGELYRLRDASLVQLQTLVRNIQ